MYFRNIPHIALLLAALLTVAADKKPTAPKPSQIQQWIKQLGDDDYRVREEATKNLIEAGGVAVEEGRKATKSKDPETKQRAWRIIKQIEKVDKEIEKKVNYLTTRGIDWASRSKHDKAIEDFTEAIRLNPRDAFIYFIRGYAWRAKSEHNKAITDYSKAIQLNPKQGSYYFARSCEWFSNGDYDKSISDISEAIRLKPKSPLFYKFRGRAWLKKGNKEKAEADFKKATELGYSP